MKLQSIFCLLSLLTLLAACAPSAVRYNSSSMEYLYPDREGIAETAGVPILRLPLKVGIAFVPDGHATPEYHRGGLAARWIAGNRPEALPESDRVKLLERVGRRFAPLTFVQRIEIIPSAYLRPRGGFANLDQIQRLFGIDVIVLLAYDQTQFTDEGAVSLTYWTIVGAYVVPGEKNTTHTLIDACVYDIESRRLLFRAPGISHIKSAATPVNLSQQLRLDRGAAFDAAVDDLLANLETQLERFKASIEKQPQAVHIAHRAGYSGGGSISLLWAVLLGVVGVMAVALEINRCR